MAENVNFVYDPVMTAIAGGLPQRTRIGGEVMPFMVTGASAFKYLVLDPKLESLKAGDSQVGATAQPNEVELGLESRDASTKDHALTHWVAKKKVDEAPEGFDALAAAANTLTERLYNGHEARVAEQVKKAANFSTVQSLGANGTKKISDETASLIQQTADFLDSPLLRPNTLVMGRNVATKFRTHPSVVKALSGSGADSGYVSLEALAELLEVERILVGDALINTSNGKVPSLSNPWAGVFAAIHINREVNPVLGESAATWGFTPQSLELQILTGEDSSRGSRGAYGVKAAFEINELVTAPDAGFLWKDVL